MAESTQRKTTAQLKLKPKQSLTTIKISQTSSTSTGKSITKKTDEGKLIKTARVTDNKPTSKTYLEKTLKNAETTPKSTKNTGTLSNQARSFVTTTKRSTAEIYGNKTTNTKQTTVPLRAQHNTESIKTHTKQLNENSSKIAKPNAVLDTFHNVTVVSPPMRRKERTNVEQVTGKEARPATCVLADEDIVLLRRESAKQRSEEAIKITESVALVNKEPVAFEVNFEEAKSPRPKLSKDVDDNEVENYSDDFESYESDFESETSSRQNETTTETTDDTADETTDSEQINNEQTENQMSKTQKANDSVHDNENENEEEEEDESFITQYPVTVIAREKEQERKLDSGNYEMNSRRQHKLSEISMQSNQTIMSSQFDSLETYSTGNSEQMDSGIIAYDNTISKEPAKSNFQAFYEGYAHFVRTPAVSKRGLELMSKIQFDMLEYTLLDMQPLTYDVYMRTYGKLHTTQSSTQTNENRLNNECQTDDWEVRTKWTQYPAKYDLQTLQELNSNLDYSVQTQNACGEEVAEKTHLTLTDALDASLLKINALQPEQNLNLKKFRAQYNKTINFEHLNTFLLRSSMSMLKVLNSVTNNNQTNKQRAHTALSSISNGYFKIDTNFLNTLQVVRVFSNSKYDLIVTVHESLPDSDVYRSEFSNLLVVWSTSENENNKPIRLLSTWNKVCRVEICNDFAEIIVCGLVDGSLAMWDLRETYTYCSKLDGYLTHFPATQSIMPMQNKSTMQLDLGAMIDVRSFRSTAKVLGISNTSSNYRSVQIASLNETGIITVWTLVETHARADNIKQQHREKPTKNLLNSPLEYSSPWARVKLIQSNICDLRDYIECRIFKKKSQFEKTMELFEKEIYNDKALKQLNPTDKLNTAEGLRFTCIDTGSDVVYVCTNQNFILACSKSLKIERLRKITLHENRSLFPTALCVLSNEDFLAVGYSNGSIAIINCNQRKFQLTQDMRPQTAFTSRPTTQAHNMDLALESGKSCAMQNLILNERRSFEHSTDQPNLQDSFRPDTAACIGLISSQKKPFELRVYDRQMILSGCALRQNLVQVLALSSDGWRLFALTNGEIRVYDFFLERELQLCDDRKVIDISTAKTNPSEQHLLLLNAHNEVQVHYIKQ